VSEAGKHLDEASWQIPVELDLHARAGTAGTG
jgi:hypothetical protein